MANLGKLLDSYISKIAFSHYDQIKSLRDASGRLAEAGNIAKDKNVQQLTSAIYNSASNLENVARTKGITAQHSASVRNSIQGQLDKLLGQEITRLNPMEGTGVNETIQLAASKVQDALFNYVPSNIAAMQPAHQQQPLPVPYSETAKPEDWASYQGEQPTPPAKPTSQPIATHQKPSGTGRAQPQRPTWPPTVNPTGGLTSFQSRLDSIVRLANKFEKQ